MTKETVALAFKLVQKMPPDLRDGLLKFIFENLGDFQALVESTGDGYSMITGTVTHADSPVTYTIGGAGVKE